MAFEALSLSDELLRAVRAASYETPTPIQTKAIPPALEGRDVLGCAQTGTGKTAAFVLPSLQRLAARAATVTSKGARPVRMLVLTPTRELAAQIAETVRDMGKFLPLKHTVIFGGVGYEPQDRAMRAGVDVLVSTPGRLIDHLGRGTVSLSHVEILVLDEADQMLDMGFIHDVRRIVAKVPSVRQTLFFSATMPPAIRALAGEWLRDPVEVSVAPPATTAERVEQELFYVESPDKRSLLEELLSRKEVTRALVFSRTKHGANKIARWLEAAGVRAEPIHGNKSQNARTRALNGFKAGTTRVLVATDLAARGLDIDEVSHVINFDLPNVPEVYVHRIGRTARAGNEGVAWSFCNVEEREYLWDIERTTRQKIPVVSDHPWASKVPVTERPARGAAGASAGGRNNGGSGGHSNARRGDAPRASGPRDGAPRGEHGGRTPRTGNGHKAHGPAGTHGGGDRARRDGAAPPRANGPSGGAHPAKIGHGANSGGSGGGHRANNERSGGGGHRAQPAPRRDHH
jgi:ATP-dependent RNA helicase RhlE